MFIQKYWIIYCKKCKSPNLNTLFYKKVIRYVKYFMNNGKPLSKP